MEVCRRRKGLKKRSENSLRKASGGGRRYRNCCLESSKIKCKMVRKSLPNWCRRLRNPPKMAPGALPGRSWEPLGPSGAQCLKATNYFEPAWGGPGGLRGQKKIHRCLPGGLQKSSWTIFQRLESPQGPFWPPFCPPRGGPGGAFSRFFFFQKTRKPWILNTFHTKTVIL